MISRRAVLAGAVAAAAAGTLGLGPAASQGAAFNRISVDVSPLRARGLGRYAGFVQGSLAQALRGAFAGRAGVRGAPDLTVRITSVQLSSWAGERERDDWGGSMTANDYMDGEAIIRQGRSVLRRHPQLSVLAAAHAGPWYAPDVDARRTEALCQHYADWLARSL